MEELFVQTLLVNPIIVHIKAFSKKLSDKTRLLRMVFKHKTKRRRERSILKKMCKFKNS